MNQFQKTILFIALVILIICLLFIGVMLYNGKYNVSFPPVVGQCPDYWESELNDKGVEICKKSEGMAIGINSEVCNGPMDFSVKDYEGATGACAKYEWAKGCQLTWDGITNNLNICKKTVPK